MPHLQWPPWLAWLRRPRVGAVAVFWPHLARKNRARWLELILSSGSYLLIVAVLSVILLPRRSSFTLDRRGLFAVLAAYLLYSLVLAVVARASRRLYDNPVFRLLRILISTGLISFVVWFSSGNASYFWFFYSLPLLQATLYFDTRGLRAVAVLVVAVYWATCSAFALVVQQPLDIRPLMMNTFALAIQAFTFYWLFGSAQARQRLNLRQLEMLNHLNEQIRLSPGFNEILQIVLREALLAVHTDEGSVMVVDSAQKKLEIRCWLVKGEPVPKVHRSFGLGEGIAGFVATTARPYNCPDVGKDPHFTPSPDDRPIRSLLSVPVVSHGKVTCVLNVDHEQPQYFQEDDVQLLTILAGDVALALESQRLRDVGLFLPTLTLDELCSMIVESACLLTGTESSTMFLLDPNTEELRSAAAYPPGRPVIRPRADGLTMQVIRSGTSLKIADIQADKRVKDSIKESGVRSLLCCPLTVRAGGPQQPPIETIGAVFVRSHQSRDFSRRDEELLQSLANQAAVALENARIRVELEEHVHFQHSLLESAFDAIIAIDAQGRIKEFNAAAESILGYTLKEIRGSRVDMLYFNQEDPRTIKRLLEEPKMDGRLINYQSAVLHKDGTRIPIRLSASLLPSGSVGFFGDLRQIETARRHISQLEQILEAIQSITHLDDVESVLHKAAGQTVATLRADMVDLYLYDEGEWLGPAVRGSSMGTEPIGEVPKPPELVETILSQGEISFPNGSAGANAIWSGDFRASVACPLQVGNRTVGFLLFHYRTERSFSAEDQAVIRLFAKGVAIAIENARLYQESRKQATRLEALFLASSGVIADLDMEAVLQNLVDQGREMTGARYGALGLVSSGGTLHPFITSGLTPEERERLGTPPTGHGLLGVLLAENQFLNLPDVTKDPRYRGWPEGHPRITSFLGVPIAMKGQPPIGNLYMANKVAGVGFSSHDLLGLRTEAALAASFIERAQAHQEASALKTMGVTFVLLSRWAHMVRQKRLALHESLTTLRKKVPGALYDDILETMEKSIQALAIPSRRLENKEEMELKDRVDLGDLLEQIVRERCEGKALGIQTGFAIDPGGYVQGNRLLLEFAVSMLVENAVESIVACGQPGWLHVRCEVQPNVVRVTLSDNGIGMSPEAQRELFRAPARSDKGFGHGGFAAAMVVKAHRGDIRLVESTAEGTTIQFWLPVLEEVQEAVPV